MDQRCPEAAVESTAATGGVSHPRSTSSSSASEVWRPAGAEDAGCGGTGFTPASSLLPRGCLPAGTPEAARSAPRTACAGVIAPVLAGPRDRLAGLLDGERELRERARPGALGLRCLPALRAGGAELGVAISLERVKLGLQRSDPGAGVGIRQVPGVLCPKRLEALVRNAAGGPRFRCGRPDSLPRYPTRSPADWAAKRRRKFSSPGAARGQRLLGRLTAPSDRLSRVGQSAIAAVSAACACAVSSSTARRRARRAPAPSGLQALTLEPGMELGGFGLALQRPQARAGLAFDVEGTIEVVLGALELQLRPAAAFAVLAETRGLLDQESAVARLDVTSDSTRPCEMTECISLPRPVSDSNSITSTSRQRAPASRYSPSPARSSRRTIDTPRY